MGVGETETRTALYSLLGNGYIRGLHMLPKEALRAVKEEKMTGEVPDFAGLIVEGMPVELRLEQFQYITDDDGNFSLDGNGDRIPRGQLPVRKYASGPDSPLAKLHMSEVDTVAFLDFEKVLDLLVKAEKKLYGLGGKAPKNNAAKPATKKEENTKMTATAKPRIMLRRPGGVTTKPQSNGEDKTPNKVKTKVAKPATAKKVKQETDSAPTKGTNGHTPSIDLAAVEALIENKVAEMTKELDAKLDAILEAVGEGPGGRSVAQTVTDATTVLHDVLQQKISNLFFALASGADEDGNPAEFDGAFPFLDEDDGRDKEQNLLEGDNPTDVVSFYMDGDKGNEEEEEE